MATGDLKNNLKQFQSQVKAIKYPSILDLEGLKTGSPKAYLPLYHYLFTSYSTKFNKDIVNSNNELYGKSDLRFMEAVYKIMRVIFSHKPAITREQFFATGFAERKLIMATEICRLVHSHYKPQKISSSFKFAANLEKPALESASVIQDVPESSKTRKVASRPSPSMSGAVVLPRSFSGSNLIKSSLRVPIPLSATPDSDIRSEGISVTPRSDHSVQEVSRPPDQTTSGIPDMTVEMTKKMADQLTHSVLFLNEKIGKMALAIQNQEEMIENNVLSKPDPVQQPSLSNSLLTNLTKQMNDIIFKLETLSSRVVLLENRMMMMETKVDDTQSLCRTVITSRNRPEREQQPVTELWLDRNYSNNKKVSSSRENQAVRQEDLRRRTAEEGSTNLAQPLIPQFTPGEVAEQRGDFQEKLLHFQTNSRPDATNDEGDNTDGNIIEVVGVEKENVAAPSANMAFMKSLIDPNSLESNVTSDDLTLSTTQIEQVGDQSTLLETLGQAATDKKVEQPHQNKTLPTGTDRFADTFQDFFSPIRSFSANNTNTGSQDASILSIPYAKDDDEEDVRRYSTPNKPSLDTSTLGRINRITQMLTETEQLFK